MIHDGTLAKCHVYDGYIREKIFADWGKKFGRTCNFAKSSKFARLMKIFCVLTSIM